MEIVVKTLEQVEGRGILAVRRNIRATCSVGFAMLCLNSARLSFSHHPAEGSHSSIRDVLVNHIRPRCVVA